MDIRPLEPALNRFLERWRYPSAGRIWLWSIPARGLGSARWRPGRTAALDPAPLNAQTCWIMWDRPPNPSSARSASWAEGMETINDPVRPHPTRPRMRKSRWVHGTGARFTLRPCVQPNQLWPRAPAAPRYRLSLTHPADREAWALNPDRSGAGKSTHRGSCCFALLRCRNRVRILIDGQGHPHPSRKTACAANRMVQPRQLASSTAPSANKHPSNGPPDANRKEQDARPPPERAEAA